MADEEKVTMKDVLFAIKDLSKDIVNHTKKNELNLEALEHRVNSRFDHQDQKLDKIISLLEGTIATSSTQSRTLDSHELRMTNLEAEQFSVRKQLKDLREG